MSSPGPITGPDHARVGHHNHRRSARNRPSSEQPLAVAAEVDRRQRCRIRRAQNCTPRGECSVDVEVGAGDVARGGVHKNTAALANSSGFAILPVGFKARARAAIGIAGRAGPQISTIARPRICPSSRATRASSICSSEYLSVTSFPSGNLSRRTQSRKSGKSVSGSVAPRLPQ